MSKLVNLRIEEDLLGRIDEAAGPRQRTAWMVAAFERALEAASGDSLGVPSGAGGSSPLSPVSPRAPVPQRIAGARIVRASSLLKRESDYKPIPRQGG